MSNPSPISLGAEYSQPSRQVTWDEGFPSLQMQDAVVETVVTTVTRTTTSFQPIPLPRIPEPASLAPSHSLSNEIYPLAHLAGSSSANLNLTIGGHKVRFINHKVPQSPRSPGLPLGVAWARTGPAPPISPDMQEFVARHAHARNRRAYRSSAETPETEMRPRVRQPSQGQSRSPPRKRARGTDGALPSPRPSPPALDPAVPFDRAPVSLYPTPTTPTPDMGSGMDVGALFSLPSLVSHFDQLQDTVQRHILTQLLCRTKRPVLQQVANLALHGLKQDFIGRLPHELSVLILRNLDSKSLANASRVCKDWCRVIDNERSIWMQRLVDEDLYIGLGVEEEDEALIRKRIDVIKKYDLPTSTIHWPVPLKHVYRRRWCSARNWLTRRPKNTSFPGIGVGGITCTAFAKGKIVAGKETRDLHVYDAHTGQLLHRLEGHTGGVWAMDFDGEVLVTGSTDRTCRVWNLVDGTVHIFAGHASTVRCLQVVQPVWYEAEQRFWPPCPVIVTGSRDGTLRVWRMPEQGEQGFYTWDEAGTAWGVEPDENRYHLVCLVGHNQPIRAIACHGRTIVSASYDRSVRVWDMIDGTCKMVLTGHEDKVYSVAYDKYRNRCASGSLDNTVRVWDLSDGSCLYKLNGQNALVGLLELSPHRLVSAATDSCLRLWNADTYDENDKVESTRTHISSFGHDAVKMVHAADGLLRLTDVRTGKHVRSLIGGVVTAWQCIIKDQYCVAATSRVGGTQYELFDFGEIRHESGVDDASLDELEEPEWKKVLPMGMDEKWYPIFVKPDRKGKGKAGVKGRQRGKSEREKRMARVYPRLPSEESEDEYDDDEDEDEDEGMVEEMSDGIDLYAEPAYHDGQFDGQGGHLSEILGHADGSQDDGSSYDGSDVRDENRLNSPSDGEEEGGALDPTYEDEDAPFGDGAEHESDELDFDTRDVASEEEEEETEVSDDARAPSPSLQNSLAGPSRRSTANIPGVIGASGRPSLSRQTSSALLAARLEERRQAAANRAVTRSHGSASSVHRAGRDGPVIVDADESGIGNDRIDGPLFAHFSPDSSRRDRDADVDHIPTVTTLPAVSSFGIGAVATEPQNLNAMQQPSESHAGEGLGIAIVGAAPREARTLSQRSTRRSLVVGVNGSPLTSTSTPRATTLNVAHAAAGPSRYGLRNVSNRSEATTTTMCPSSSGLLSTVTPTRAGPSRTRPRTSDVVSSVVPRDAFGVASPTPATAPRGRGLMFGASRSVAAGNQVSSVLTDTGAAIVPADALELRTPNAARTAGTELEKD